MYIQIKGICRFGNTFFLFIDYNYIFIIVTGNIFHIYISISNFVNKLYSIFVTEMFLLRGSVIEVFQCTWYIQCTHSMSILICFIVTLIYFILFVQEIITAVPNTILTLVNMGVRDVKSTVISTSYTFKCWTVICVHLLL